MEITELQCVACEEEAPHTMYVQEGNCMTTCADGFQIGEYGGAECVAIAIPSSDTTTTTTTTTTTNNNDEELFLVYPTRKGKHSSSLSS